MDRLAAAWNRAEECLKIAEQTVGETAIPAINELRYAGRKMVEAHEVGDPTRASELLRDATFDCHRAQHDALDVAVTLMVSRVDTMTDRLGFSRVVAALPDLSDFLADLPLAQERIARSRRDRVDRAKVYDEIGEIDLPRLRERYQRLVASEDRIALEVRRERRWKAASVAIGIVGIVLALLALLL